MKTYQWIADPRGGYNDLAMWTVCEWPTEPRGQWFVTVGYGVWQSCYYAVMDDYGVLQPVRKMK